MSDAAYWGPFAAARELRGLQLTESPPYEGFSAEVMSTIVRSDGDLPDYVALAQRCGDPVLELGCGTGRVLLALARGGCRVVGIERSADMLAILRTRLTELPEDAQARVELVEGDATTMALGRAFPLILLPASSIVVFAEFEERRRLLQAAAAHLAPGGTFVFDYVRFSPAGVASCDEQIVSMQIPVEGAIATAYLGMKFSPDGTELLVNAYCQVPRCEDQVEHHLEAKRLTLIGDDELDYLLDESGLVLTRLTSEALPGGVGERRLVCATARTGVRYPLWHPYVPMNTLPDNLLTLTSGNGCRVWADDGSEYIDASGGLWSTQCGLGHPDIVEAVNRQLKRLSYGTLFAHRGNEPALKLARELVEMAPSPLQWVYLTNSGSESVELAIKLARLHAAVTGQPDRKQIAYLDESYHGTFFGSMAVTGLYPQKEAFGPLLPGVVPVATPSPSRRPPGVSYETFALECATDLERRIEEASGQVAAFILEPVLGSAGVIVPPKEYLMAVQRICRAHGVLLVLDEVATGFGRTGLWFAAEHFGMRPDMMLLAKGICSGYLPLGAVLFSGEIATSLIDRGVGIGHGSSHNGNPVCCAAALETIAVMRRERLVERAAEMGGYFRARLEKLRRHDRVSDVRSLGLMLGLELRGNDGARAPAQDLAAVYLGLQRRGVLGYPAPSGLLFLPALVITRQEVNAVVDALDDALSSLPPVVVPVTAAEEQRP